MKLSFEQIKEKHSTGVNGVYEYLQKFKFDPHLVNSEEYKNIKFERLCDEYSKYKRVSSRFTAEKTFKQYKKIVEKFSKRQYIFDRIDKYQSLDHLYHGDIFCKSPINKEIDLFFKVVNSRFLRRYSISRFKGQYVVLYNSENVSKSRVAKTSYIKTYLDAICCQSKWKAMPSKKRNKVLQCMDKFENHCTLEEFCTMFFQYELADLNDFSELERTFFIKRNYNRTSIK